MQEKWNVFYEQQTQFNKSARLRCQWTGRWSLAYHSSSFVYFKKSDDVLWTTFQNEIVRQEGAKGETQISLSRLISIFDMICDCMIIINILGVQLIVSSTQSSHFYTFTMLSHGFPVSHDVLQYCLGVISRTLGIMPEKAFKMQGFFIVKKLIDYQNEKSFIIKWLIAGSAAGAATTIIGG